MVYMYIQFSCHVCNLFCLKLCCIKRLEHLIKMDMALYKSYVLLLLLLLLLLLSYITNKLLNNPMNEITMNEAIISHLQNSTTLQCSFFSVLEMNYVER